MYNEFLMYYPFLERHVRDWSQINNFEIEVVLDDGKRIIYNTLEKGMRYVKDIPKDLTAIEDKEVRYAFAKQLHSKMLMKGYTQKTLSNETGISQVTISNYTHCRATPSLTNMLKLSKALNCSIGELVDE